MATVIEARELNWKPDEWPSKLVEGDRTFHRNERKLNGDELLGYVYVTWDGSTKLVVNS